MTESWRAALYYRVVNATGATDQQFSTLAGVASERGWTVVATFHDRASFLQAAARREFEIAVIFSLDQLGDSLREVVATVHQLCSHGMHLYVHEQCLDTGSPTGPAVLSVFTALVEFERAKVGERSRTGLQRARRTGTRIGRPSNVNDSVRAAIIALRARDLLIRRIAAQLRVGTGTVYKVLGAEA